MRTQTIPLLPKAVERIEVRELIEGGLVISAVLYGPTDALTLKRLGERMREDLLSLPGVVRLGDFSAEARYEVAILISSARLYQHQLTLKEVAEAVHRNSLDLPGGCDQITERRVITAR